MAQIRLRPHIEQPRAQGLPSDRGVEIAFIANGVEVEFAPVDGQIPAPVVGHALVDHVAPLGYLRYPIRAALQRQRQRRFRQVLSPPVVRRHDWDVSDDVELLGHVRLRVNDNLRGVHDLHRSDPVQHGFPARGHDVRAKGLERELDVGRGNRRPVVPPRLRAQPENDAPPIRADGDGFGETRVVTRGFVARALDQVIVRAVEPFRLVHRRNRVEADRRRQHQRAALRRIGVDIVEMGEIGGVFEVVVGYLGDAVMEVERGLGGRERERKGDQGREQRGRNSSRCPNAPGHRIRVLTACIGTLRRLTWPS